MAVLLGLAATAAADDPPLDARCAVAYHADFAEVRFTIANRSSLDAKIHLILMASSEEENWQAPWRELTLAAGAKAERVFRPFGAGRTIDRCWATVNDQQFATDVPPRPPSTGTPMRGQLDYALWFGARLNPPDRDEFYDPGHAVVGASFGLGFELGKEDGHSGGPALEIGHFGNSDDDFTYLLLRPHYRVTLGSELHLSSYAGAGIGLGDGPSRLTWVAGTRLGGSWFALDARLLGTHREIEHFPGGGRAQMVTDTTWALMVGHTIDLTAGRRPWALLGGEAAAFVTLVAVALARAPTH